MVSSGLVDPRRCAPAHDGTKASTMNAILLNRYRPADLDTM
jgi:hypothetical protein